jgi:hypothetical protein
MNHLPACLLAILVVMAIGVTSAQKIGYFCGRRCDMLDGHPSCGNGTIPVVRTVKTSACYVGPGQFRGSTQYSSYAVLPDRQSPDRFSVVFFSGDKCDHNKVVATTSKCPLGRCCLGDFMIPPSSHDLVGDVPFFYVQAGA